jgi:hypothetical protein
VRAGLGLGRHERLLAAARLQDGGWLVTTSTALVAVDVAAAADDVDAGPVLRHLWHDVAEATWDPEDRTVAVRWAAPGEPPLRLRLADPSGSVPEVLRERVMSTYVLSQRVPVRGRRGVTVAVRRHAVDGSLLVQAVPDDGIDPSRPATADKVAELARELAAQVGLRD